MTLETVVPRQVYIGSGGRGPFQLQNNGTPIRLRVASDLVVTRYDSVTDADGTTLTLDVDYTVVNTDPDAATFTLTSAQEVLTSSQRIVATRDQSIAQNLSLTLGGNFGAVSDMAQRDIVAEQIQELRRDVDRSVKVGWRETAEISLPLAPSSTQPLGQNTSGEIVHYDAPALAAVTAGYLVGAESTATGDGSTVEFDIEGIGASVSNHLDILIDGIGPQPWDSYDTDLVGTTTTVTFDDAPPNGSYIQFRPRVFPGIEGPQGQQDRTSLSEFASETVPLVGDGTTTNNVAIAAAEASGDRITAAEGDYKTSALATGAAVTGRYDGPGQIKTNDNNKRAPIFRAISAAPSSLGTHNGPEQAFNGDLSNVYEAIEYRITGAATAGQPTSGYLYRPEISMSYRYLYSTSGHNQSTSGAGGRTGIVASRTALFQAGQGDLVAYNFTAVATSTLSGSTHFLANPAIVGFNGDMTAGADGIYFNGYETYYDDASYDVAGIGAVYNLDRNDATGAKSAFWAGVRVQSRGTERPDAMYSGSGSFETGLNLTGVTLNTDKAGIVLKESDRIYLEGTNSDPNAGDNGIATGDTWIERNVSGSISLVYNNASVGQINDFWAFFPQKVNTSDSYEVDAIKVVGNRATGWGAPTGTATRTTYVTSTVTLEQLAQRVKALIDDLTTHGLIGS